MKLLETKPLEYDVHIESKLYTIQFTKEELKAIWALITEPDGSLALGCRQEVLKQLQLFLDEVQ